VVTQLLVSNNRYESPYAAAGPGFSPEAGAVFLLAPLWATTCIFGRCSFQGGVFARRPSRGSDQRQWHLKATGGLSVKTCESFHQKEPVYP
jgi:hypothetical protein